jgi:hypothetical protein
LGIKSWIGYADAMSHSLFEIWQGKITTLILVNHLMTSLGVILMIWVNVVLGWIPGLNIILVPLFTLPSLLLVEIYIDNHDMLMGMDEEHDEEMMM